MQTLRDIIRQVTEQAALAVRQEEADAYQEAANVLRAAVRELQVKRQEERGVRRAAIVEVLDALGY